MTSKFVEIRDVGTCVPALAIQIAGPDDWCASRAGFGDVPCVYLVMLATEHAKYDPFNWDSLTMRDAHLWLVENFHEHIDGAVLDVRFIRGETAAPVKSDRFYEYSR